MVLGEGGKLEYPDKNLSKQSGEPTKSTHLRRRVRASNPGDMGGRRALSLTPALTRQLPRKFTGYNFVFDCLPSTEPSAL